MTELAVGVRGVTKRFGGQTALADVDLDVHAGTIHAIAGENGAGKSTLIKVLAGVHRPDSGHLVVDGQEIVLRNPRETRSLRFGFLHQQLNLVPDLSVRENIQLTMPYPLRAGIAIDWRRVDSRCRRHLELVDLDVGPKALLRDLNPAQQQLVALARVLSEDPRLIVLDEPTATLGENDSAHLLELVIRQREAGATVIFVSHRLDEILQICDTVTVLRDGRIVATVPRSELDRDRLVRMLGGAAEHHEHLGRDHAVDEVKPRLEMESVAGPGLDLPTSLVVHQGEVIGLAGLVGSGRSTLLSKLAGGSPITSGEVRLDGRPISITNRREARKHGIVYLPAERNLGAIPDFSVPENITAGHVERYALKGAVLEKGRERRTAAKFVDQLSIKLGKGDDRIRSLSGGNQQKVLIARALDLSPTVLLLDEPTAGIDIATKEYILRLVRELADTGMSIIFVSSELDELPLVCDRIAIFKRGRVMKELPGSTTRGAIVSELFAREE